MIKEICVIGHPSYYGGADTELLDQIKCWSKMGIKVYLLHTGPIAQYFNSMKLTELYGCIYLRPRMWSDINGMHCISFCNGEFLSNISLIKRHAKTTTFVNCMTWNFEKEIHAQSLGLIDHHLYQTQHGFERVSKKLITLGKPFNYYIFDPYFDIDQFKFHETRTSDHFRFGRISRSDIAKYHKEQFIVYDKINSPIKKSGVVLGWDLRVAKKCMLDHKTLIRKEQKLYYKDYIQLLAPSGTTQKEFYEFCDVLISYSDTFENLPRVAFECMASGTVPVVDNRGGWTLQIDDGRTGFLCNSTEEFIKKSTLLAQNNSMRDEFRYNGYEKLKMNWGLEKSMSSWEKFFNRLEK